MLTFRQEIHENRYIILKRNIINKKVFHFNYFYLKVENEFSIIILNFNYFMFSNENGWLYIYISQIVIKFMLKCNML